ncbi:bacteriophage protein [Shigella sonnei]|uniref:YdaU family protein n=1 Tax=Shigella sonnei TaxID=624 RepID=UPI000663BDE4|nr:YdaU family protein [Shigella sonnei]CTA30209.1 bacteriophage protein [Shigella sonnei]CTA39965.1 bacteriophage protein [Shigella sonnei]CTA49690.1 bacteriophage protein [Shigella sonnei]CTA54009.1 bacteriophage protein [Shigella sonnei]CTA55714.1 bacteriophage protein [Shigella sonnei]
MLFVLILSHRAASYGAIMAALPYMQLYIADYLADTMHLSVEEHGAYLLLMFNYWQTGKPIPKNRLAKIARLTNERWADVEPSLQEFFCDNGEEWVHLRIAEDLASVREKLTKKSAAGKASVQARRSRKEADVQTKQERNLTGVQTDVEVVFEHDVNTKATNKDTDKDLKTDPPLNPPRGNRGVKKFDPLDIALPNWISVSLWREWVEFRQALRKPIRTEQGANGAIRELEKFRQQGFSPEQVIRHSIANEYQGLFAPKGVRPETLLRQVNTVSLPDSAIPPGFRG